MCIRVCGKCTDLEPVQLSPEATLMLRLFELHLDPRQEVPPDWAVDRLTHHHNDAAEVYLT